MMPPRNHFALRTQSRCFFCNAALCNVTSFTQADSCSDDSHWMPKAGDSMLLPTGHGRCELLQRICIFLKREFWTVNILKTIRPPPLLALLRST